MGKFWISSLIITLVVANWWFCNGCWDEERFALLQLKSSLNYPNGNSLPLWSEDNKSNCCEWPNVVCDTTTKHVVEISLKTTKEDIVVVQSDWHFNASLFLPFKMLRALSLASNGLVGWVENQGHERLSNLKRLEFLSLDGNGISDFESVCSINDFTNLKVLDISDNTFQSFGPMKGLLNLKILKASTNRFDNSIFSSLKQFPSLKVLDLSVNDAIKGSVDMNELPALKELYLMGTGVDNIVTNNKELLGLTNLQELDLSSTGVDNFVTSKGIANVSHLQVLRLDNLDASISNFSNLLPSLTVFSSLKTLYFQGNSFLDTHDWKNLSKLENLILDGTNFVDKNILNNIGGLLSLKVISLSECGISGDLPNRGWCELKNLQELRLSKNELNGMLPSCLGNLTSLRLIDLSTNQFYGNIAISPFYKLTSLESLTISNNHFQVPFSFDSFSNHSNLKFILAANNEVISETNIKNLVPSYKLEFFSLSNCVGKYPRLPSFLLHQNQLRILDLSYNNVGGDFPAWLLENNTKLEGFYMGGNAFNGDLKFPQKPNIHIGTIDISMNNISGQIPKDINIVFPNIVVLNMSWNNLVGSLPSSFCGLNSLAYLDLSNNNLTGELPHGLATSCWSLQYLKLSNNKFQGKIIFPGALNTYQLSVLQLDNNNFVGTIPDNLSTIFVTLRALDLGNNHLYGELPKCLGNMMNLNGPIPIELCKLGNIELLDMSDNRLSGSIPSCFNPTSLKHLHLSNNLFGGQLTRAFFNMPSLATLDLRNNKFRGRIPKWISNLRVLNILLLQGNYFEGTIPSQLCQLIELSMLDLSYNNLSGSIPRCLDKMTLAMGFSDFHKYSTIEVASSPMTWATLSYLKTSKLATTFHLPLAVIDDDYYPLTDGDVTAEFTSKLLSHSYKGIVLKYMSAVDLSCNQLSGNIPLNLGNLSEIRALNLSHNNLTGAIPTTLSGLVKVESLDLSYNMLNGKIPAQLTELNFLEVFSVAHNNLSGPIPDRKAQFATFDESSYEGNALLCGPPLSNLCTQNNEPPPQVLLPDNGKEESNFMDMKSFYISFVVSYIVMLLIVIVVLCINPYWRRTWFDIIGFYAISCYHFALDSFS
nr:LRR receptor-like serine/threonine-protein kinase GSO1 [Ipomoea batatas]GME05430.1 LRR receptor-like serine/threonine-protein kinase GSO1 [Ipomoea batatas]